MELVRRLYHLLPGLSVASVPEPLAHGQRDRVPDGTRGWRFCFNGGGPVGPSFFMMLCTYSRVGQAPVWRWGAQGRSQPLRSGVYLLSRAGLGSCGSAHPPARRLVALTDMPAGPGSVVMCGDDPSSSPNVGRSHAQNTCNTIRLARCSRAAVIRREVASARPKGALRCLRLGYQSTWFNHSRRDSHHGQVHGKDRHRNRRRTRYA